VPGGNLGNSSSLGKALQELKEWGFLNKIPRILIVQAQGANPLYQTWMEDCDILKEVPHAHTLATAIKIGRPVSWRKALRALDFSRGDCEQVDETEIADAKSVLGQDGIGCEPASATTVAGLKKLQQKGGQGHKGFEIRPDEDVVAILTGHQLKDPDYTVRYYTDNLYESAVQKVEWENPSGKIHPSFLNRPIQVKADKKEIARLLKEAMSLLVVALLPSLCTVAFFL
jgi:threonine synthase